MAFPKLAGAALVALLLMTTIASSYGEMSPKGVKLVRAKIFIDEEDEVVSSGKPHIEQVTANQLGLKCSNHNGYCNSLVLNSCCQPLVCKEYPIIGGQCKFPYET